MRLWTGSSYHMCGSRHIGTMFMVLGIHTILGPLYGSIPFQGFLSQSRHIIQLFKMAVVGYYSLYILAVFARYIWCMRDCVFLIM
jgi:hypothetical protein